MTKNRLPEHALIIPHRDLAPETLRAVIEQFVSRDGADPGHNATPLDLKIQAVHADLDRGMALLVYDTRLATCNIVLKREIE